MFGNLFPIEIVADNRLPLANSLAKYFNVDIIHADLSRFADTESIISIEDPKRIEGKIVVLVSQFSFDNKKRTNSINDQLFQTLLLAHQVKAHRAKGIVLLMPYLPYSRQSRSVTGLYVGPLQATGAFYRAGGVDHVISCDVHEPLCRSIFPLPLHEVGLERLWYQVLTNEFKEREIKDICFVSPDRGGIDRVKHVVKVFKDNDFDLPWAFVEKKREEHDKSIAVNLVGDVKDKIVILIDDIIDTGRTADQAVKMVKKHGAKKVFACFTHAVLAHGACERIKNSDLEHAWITNSTIIDGGFSRSNMTIISIDDMVIHKLDTFLKRR